MKKTLLLIVPLLFLFVGCDDNTPTNEDIDDMMSLDWILLKKGVDTEFYVESCDGYDLCDCDINSNDECGECYLETKDGDDYYLYEYKLYWNEDLSVCRSDDGCNEEDLGNYDIFIPSHIPMGEDDECSCENFYSSYHPNCDTPLDTTMVFNGKEVSFEKMGWIDRGGEYQGFGYLHYYPLDDIVFCEDWNQDISSWIVVDYQRKEYPPN
tara:strand:- start:478 stop:1107 length:630 start_codon:yes stop_codon:yes gene_type:complete